MSQTLSHTEHQEAPPAFVPEIEVGSQVSLLKQIERLFTLSTMQIHAKTAWWLMSDTKDESPDKVEKFVNETSRLRLVQSVDQKDPHSIVWALVAASLLTSAKAGAQTSMEKLENAMGLLSDEYQADW